MNRNGQGGRAAPNGYKILSIFLAAVLVIAAITELILWQMDYIVFQNPKEATEQEDGGAPIDENGEELPTGGEATAMPKAMTFRSAAALDGETEYDTVTLTATVLPENATNKSVEWSVRFKNASSAWASGKTVTDYITVTPESDGANKAAVQCLQDFGEQIEVVATSRDNASASAVCTVDFAKRIEDIKIYGHYISMSGISVKSPNAVATWMGNLDSTGNDCWFSIEYSDYTIDDFVSFETTHILSLYSGRTESPNDDGIGFYVVDGAPLYMSFESDTKIPALSQYLVGGIHHETLDKDAVNAWIYSHGDEDGYVYLLSYAATIEGEYSSFSFEVPIRFMASSFKVAAQSVELDQTETTI